MRLEGSSSVGNATWLGHGQDAKVVGAGVTIDVARRDRGDQGNRRLEIAGQAPSAEPDDQRDCRSLRDRRSASGGGLGGQLGRIEPRSEAIQGEEDGANRPAGPGAELDECYTPASSR